MHIKIRTLTFDGCTKSLVSAYPSERDIAVNVYDDRDGSMVQTGEGYLTATGIAWTGYTEISDEATAMISAAIRERM